ncbi:hypothetical protein QWA68_007088, partial [Fusarium oxysporum]
MLGIKAIILSCLLFGAVQAFTAQQKPTDPNNDKPTNHLQLAKRSMAKNDQPTNHPQLAKRSMTGHDKPTDHPKLARRTIEKPSKPTIHPKLLFLT